MGDLLWQRGTRQIQRPWMVRGDLLQRGTIHGMTPAALTEVTRLRILDLDAGKGRQVIKCIHIRAAQYSSSSECSASVLATLHHNG